MKTVFISSVISDFEEYRQAAKRAVEIMGDSPVMSEDFGARPYSPEKACVTEVETSDVYIAILGEKYGFLTPEGISVTQISSHFAPPSRIKQLAMAAHQFIESNSCWLHIGLKEMNYTSVKELPQENLNSGITMRTLGENEADFRKLFVPFTEKSYDKWIEQCIKRFQRIFS